MAKTNAVWGIDIGQCALKAMRCSAGADGNLVVDAFDYIEYPKILSQPDVEPEQMVKEALKQFLSRNSVRGDKIAISVPGQAGLARFIKLPPVEPKKVPDIVKYEAKTQIPFALEDVIWDYQALSGGVDEEGMAAETEVGLFAMKRDQVFRSIRPLDDAGLELDLVQLSPLCVYNAIVHNYLGQATEETYDPDNPPESLVIMAMGTDTTDLVVTNGFRVWQRSIPIGGNHFTKQLTKEMKLTFAKAEHLKRNAREAEDPKAVFQAMRTVFSDMVTEVQRSLGFFQSLDKTAKLSKIVALGNGFKMPGLQHYLTKNLDMDVELVDEFERLEGPATSDPKFKENVLGFGVCYGLCLQGLQKAKLRTNLVPRELVRARIIREKKPWMVAGISILMAALAFNYLFHWNRWTTVHEDKYAEATRATEDLDRQSQDYKSKDVQLLDEFKGLKDLGDEVVGLGEGRLLMVELWTAVNSALPKTKPIPEEKVNARTLQTNGDIFIDRVDSKFYPDVAEWLDDQLTEAYVETKKSLAAIKKGQQVAQREAPAEVTDENGNPVEGAPEDDTLPADDLAADAPADDAEMEDEPAELAEGETPEGSGWVIEIQGKHFHNMAGDQGSQYLLKTLITNLTEGKNQVAVWCRR